MLLIFFAFFFLLKLEKSRILSLICYKVTSNQSNVVNIENQYLINISNKRN